MSENKNSMVASAMSYAIPLGLFWVFKYLFVILGDYSELSKYINNILAIGTPVLYYVLICKYRDRNLGGRIDYGSCILFSLLLILFASFIELAIVCLHIFILKPEFLDQFREKLLVFADNFSMAGDAYKEQVKALAANMGIYYISTWLIMNIILGLFLSLIIGYFVSRDKPQHFKNT